jgi:ATP-dependent protease HslVU (ClpYQ) peptidase subunit
MMLLEELKEEQPEKQWNNILRKAVKKSKVKQKDAALTELRELGEIAPD